MNGAYMRVIWVCKKNAEDLIWLIWVWGKDEWSLYEIVREIWRGNTIGDPSDEKVGGTIHTKRMACIIVCRQSDSLGY